PGGERAQNCAHHHARSRDDGFAVTTIGVHLNSIGNVRHAAPRPHHSMIHLAFRKAPVGHRGVKCIIVARTKPRFSTNSTQRRASQLPSRAWRGTMFVAEKPK